LQSQDYKYDAGKPRVDLVTPEFILGLGEVLAFGARKYEEESWKQVEEGKKRYYAAAMRHLLHWKSEQNDSTVILDSESGLPTLAHAGCCVMFIHFLEQLTAHRSHRETSNV
jgi:hypothetical protein